MKLSLKNLGWEEEGLGEGKGEKRHEDVANLKERVIGDKRKGISQNLRKERERGMRGN